MTGSGSLDKGSKKGITVIVGIVATIALLLGAYLGTGLSMTVEEWSSAEVPFVGVGFNVAVKNDGLFAQTKTVHCEVRTSDGVYNASREVSLAPGERTNFYMVIPILGLDTDDIREKRCYASLL
ncbi:hypothetical protein AOA80_08400 [Methanomassiliicoccales archaeon RumEn M1]|jgi:hypothetical protein|nr:hypothetical protein AOA80_08400 [Methanomassiliicoccales archaeon RumEn M1]